MRGLSKARVAQARKLQASAAWRLRKLTGKRHPVVSLIIPMYNVEAYIADCLDSVLAQTYPYLDVVIVDDGSPDGSYEIAARYAAKDSRIRVIRQANAGLGAARNAGAAAATGDFLGFLDSDDKLPPKSTELLVASASGSGSDIIVGALTRFNDRRQWQSEWMSTIHAKSLHRVNAAGHPAMIRNNYACGKLFRRTFWESAGPSFRTGVAYEDQPLVTEMFIRAKAVDILTEQTYLWRMREDQSSLSQQTGSRKDLNERVLAWQLSDQLFRRIAPRAVYNEWLYTLTERHFQWYLQEAPAASQEFWDGLRDAITTLMTALPDAVWRRTSAGHRVALHYLSVNDRAGLAAFLEAGGATETAFEIVARGDRFVRLLPIASVPGSGVPDQYLDVPASQLKVISSLRRLTWEPDGSLTVTGQAYIDGLNLHGWPPAVQVELVNGGTRIAATTTAIRDDLIWPKRAVPGRPDYLPAQFRANFPADSLPRAEAKSSKWQFYATVETAGVTRSAPIARVDRWGSAGSFGAHAGSDGTLYTFGYLVRRHFQLRVAGLDDPTPAAAVSSAPIQITGAWLRTGEADGAETELRISYSASLPAGTDITFAFTGPAAERSTRAIGIGTGISSGAGTTGSAALHLFWPGWQPADRIIDGEYLTVTARAGGKDVDVHVSPELYAAMPLGFTAGDHPIRLERAAAGTLALSISPARTR